MRTRPVVATALLLFLQTPGVEAHSVPTHQNITRAAVEYLRSNAPEFACFNDSLVQIGTEHEDDIPRMMFHFYPALDGTVFSSTCSSPAWGLRRSPTCSESGLPWYPMTLTNNFTWPVAVDHAKDSTMQPSDQGWVEFGYVLHLLEDLTSPAHVRGDPHPPGDGDPVEGKTRTPTAPTGALVSFSTPFDLFASLQRWTQSNFYSKDTCFEPNQLGPTAARNDKDYFYDADGNKIAYRGLRYMLSGLSDSTRDKTKTTIDDAVADEQFTRLGPQAVLYAASLMRFYSQQAGPLISPIRNSGAESGNLSGWTTDTTFGYVAATTEEKSEGRYSARIGRWDQPYQQGGCFRCGSVPNAEPDGTDFMYQDVSLPAGGTGPMNLSFDYDVVTYDGANYDWFDAVISDASTGATLLTAVNHVGGIINGSPANWGLYYTTGWRGVNVDLSSYRGRKIRIQYRVTQDGFGDQIATYIDRVRLACN